jgi:aminopeptidase N
MERPTPEQIKEARARLRGYAENHDAIERLAGAPRSYSLLKEDFDAIRTLLAATEAAMDEEIPEQRRNHFRMEAYRHAGPTLCVDQRGDQRFDVYFGHRPDERAVWTPLQVWQFGRWSLHAGSKK